MIKRLFSSQLRLNIASGMIATVINTIVMAVGYPIYLHYLGYEKYGLWLVLSVVLTFAQLGNLGIGSAVTKLVAEEYGRGNVEAIQHYITTALVLLCLSGSAVLITILLFKGKIVAIFRLSDANAQAVSSLVPYVGILSIYVFVVQVFDATLSGLGRMDLANCLQSVSRIVGVTVAAILLYIGWGIESLLIGNTLSYVFIHIISLICIRRIVHIRLLWMNNMDFQRGRRILHFGGTIFGGTLMSMLLHPFNRFVLARYVGIATLPIYEIGFNINGQIRGMIDSGMRALVPEISHLSSNATIESYQKIRGIDRRLAKPILAGAAILYGFLFIAAEPILKLWLGQRFVNELPWVVRIIGIGSLLTVLGVPAYYTVMALGRVHHVFLGHALQSCVSVLCIYIIVIKSGFYSVNIVAFISSFAMVLGAWYMVLQKNLALRYLSIRRI